MDMKPLLEVGYAQQVVTPPLRPPAYLAGFGRNRVAQSVHDDLYVRVLALRQGERQLAFAALDLIGLLRADCKEIETRAQSFVPGVRVITACTHVHHGPDTIGLWGPDVNTSGVNPSYMNNLKMYIVEAIRSAFAAARPASLRSASVQAAGVAKNARDPHILDEELTCLQFCAPEAGDVLATWLIYPCHPEVLWDGNPHITSDYVHTLREEVEAAADAPALFMAGALGGMMTPDVRDHSFEESAQMGRTLAGAALTALDSAPAAPVEDFVFQTHEFEIPLRSLLLEQALQIGLINDVRDGQGSMTTEASLIGLGSTWLAAVPGELLPKLGLLFKAEMARAGAQIAAVIGLANDEIGYILPDEDYIYPENPFEPGDHYEETMSVGPQAGSRLLTALRSLIADQDKSGR